MTRARSELLDLEASPYYHCISRGVPGPIFVVKMHHYHRVLRIDREKAREWDENSIFLVTS